MNFMVEQTFPFIYTDNILVNCEWDEWKLGVCDKSCGGGTRINTRIKKTDARNGGKECNGPATKTEKCNTNKCPGMIPMCTLTSHINFMVEQTFPFIYIYNIIVNCEWEEWKLGVCDKSCGGGTRMNTRIKKTDARNGGKECNGPATKTEKCNTNKCTGMPPMFFLISMDL